VESVAIGAALAALSLMADAVYRPERRSVHFGLETAIILGATAFALRGFSGGGSSAGGGNSGSWQSNRRSAYPVFFSFSRNCLRNFATFGATTNWQ
jgi:hypothetical protein